MKNRKQKIVTMVIMILVTIFITTSFGIVYASNTVTKNEMKTLANEIEKSEMSKEDILKEYDKITREYSNEELANMVEENKEQLKKYGVSEDVISMGADFIRTTDTKEVRKIIEENVDLEDVKAKLAAGYTPTEILKSIVKETPTDKKIEMTGKLLWSNQIVKTIVICLIVLFIYGTFLRWRIYQKAGEPGWAALVPFYRQLVMYRVCELTPLFMLLWFIPILGWIAMFIIAIAKRFILAKSFGKGNLFGLGLLFLPPIFQSILAFNSKIEYIGVEE